MGAGAVGQVYGRHLQLGGAEVTLFVRDRYRAQVARGFDMYPLNRRPRVAPVRFDGFAVVSDADEVFARRFDQVYLTVSSPALAGPWLAALIAAAGDATIVSLQPGLDDRARVIAAGGSDRRLVSGAISLISYAAPLPGEIRFPRPGTAYWFPPLVPSPLSGPLERTRAVVAALRAGRLPARRHADVPRALAFPSAVMMPYLVALERAGWSLRALAGGDAMALGERGARAALAAVAALQGRGRAPLLARVMAHPRVLRAGLWLAERVMPLPVEIYLREHFTKVHDQTIEMMASYIAAGARAGIDVTALEALVARVPPQPGSDVGKLAAQDQPALVDGEFPAPVRTGTRHPGERR